MLELRGLNKRFGRTVALDGLDLDLADGEILALLGPTGAGKSTTLRCVAGLEKPDSGSIRLAGQDVSGEPALGRDLAFVFESFNLLSTLSVADNIALPLRSPVWGLPPAEAEARVRRAADTLHITHLLARDTATLSGGERQRVAIARALVRKPALYLLDEPLSALDLKLREELRVELKALHEREQATMLYATHDYHGAAALARRLALIDGGRVLQVGTLDELFAAPSSAAVGRLLGSPAMAFLPARIDGSRASIDGTDLALDLAAPAAAGKAVLLGIWPEDIEVVLEEAPGFLPASVWATDFRGMDRAVQLQAGPHPFRLVVPLDRRMSQGDAVWFRFPAERLFLFDAASGARIVPEGRP